MNENQAAAPADFEVPTDFETARTEAERLAAEIERYRTCLLYTSRCV